jgi:hypothetical protein
VFDVGDKVMLVALEAVLQVYVLAPVATNVAVWPTQMELKPLTLINGRGVTVNVIGVDVTLHAAVFVFITV